MTIFKENFYFILVSIFFVFTYFSSEFVSEYNDFYYAKKSNYQAEIDTLKIHHKKVLKLSETNEIVKDYKNQYVKKNDAKKIFNRAKKDSKIFSFNDNWHFSYIIGRGVYKVVLMAFLLIWFLSRQKKNKGMIILVSTCFSLSLFEIYWAFQPFNDVSKFSYYFFSLVCMFLFTYSFIWIKKFNVSKHDKLKAKNEKLEEIREKLVIHTILHSDPEKKKEILDYIESTY